MTNPLIFAKPLTAVDEILHLDDDSIVGKKLIRVEEHFFKGHYPDFPIYPGVFVVESIAQTARHYLHEHHLNATLTEVKTRFLNAVRPGDHVEFHLKMKKIDEGKTLRVIGKCLNNQIEASTVKLFYKLESES